MLLIEALKELNASIKVHLVVKGAEIASAEGGLPAFQMHTFVDSHHMRLVLTKVQTLSWMYLTSYSHVKVLV